jgi:hypothetical protein
MSRNFRDFQLAGKGDIPVGHLPSVIANVFQAKYSIPVGDSGLQVPISFTASNRTELIKKKEMRGNIGITFDLDKLFARPK